jgi:hypothetical protein
MNKQEHNKSPSIDKIANLVHQLMQENLFGELHISFRKGQPHTIKVHRSIKLDDL